MKFYYFDKSPPKQNIPGVDAYDPFLADVYVLGNVIRLFFLQVRFAVVLDEPITNSALLFKWNLGFNFMEPLVRDMIALDPNSRPPLDEVVARFETICKSLSTWRLRSRVIPHNETIAMPFRAIPHWLRRIRYIFIRKPAIPSLTK